MLKNLFKPENYILLGIPVLFLIGWPMHFLYEWSGNNIIIGAFTPVNESVFEHVKLIILPLILWWSIYFFINKAKLNFDRWFTALFFSLISVSIAIPLIYYFYTYALNIESMVLDILLALIALFIGQMIGWHLYKHFSGFNGYIMIIFTLIIFLLFVYLTYSPLKVPLFYDKTNNKYGR